MTQSPASWRTPRRTVAASTRPILSAAAPLQAWADDDDDATALPSFIVPIPVPQEIREFPLEMKPREALEVALALRLSGHDRLSAWMTVHAEQGCTLFANWASWK
jgi:hypothetical protein